MSDDRCKATEKIISQKPSKPPARLLVKDMSRPRPLNDIVCFDVHRMRRPLPIVNQLAVGFFAFVSAQNELIGDYRMSSF